MLNRPLLFLASIPGDSPPLPTHRNATILAAVISATFGQYPSDLSFSASPIARTLNISYIQQMEVLMRSRLVLLTLSFYLALTALGCTSKPSTDNSASPDAQGATANSGQESGKE